MAAGTFDAVLTFVQELTEAVRASKDSMLVAAIPESDIEIGGEGGQKAMEILEHTFGRMEAIWKPVGGAEEGFEIVRRRLFCPYMMKPAKWMFVELLVKCTGRVEPIFPLSVRRWLT